MKKTFLICCLICCLIFLCLKSCNQVIFYDSLEKYIQRIEREGSGFSNCRIDDAETFLPSQTFLTDFNYEKGVYTYKDFGFIKNREIAILILNYTNEIYNNAKSFVDLHMDLSQTNTFQHNNYYFAENMAHPKHYGYGENTHLSVNGNNKYFPNWFTMYCYNNEKNILGFIGLYEYNGTPNVGNWGNFLDTYYGSYYSFND